MKLSIVIPVYNEEATIRSVLERVRRVPLSEIGVEREIIVVDDCSQDGTRERLEKLGHLADVIRFHDVNKGKGAALRTGFEAATGDLVVVQDADREYDPMDYLKLLPPILDGRADVVYGSRFRGGEAGRVLYFWHYVGNRALTMISNMTTNLNLTDMETCYKMFRRECLASVSLEQNRFGFEPEFTAKLAKGGWRFYEVGIGYDGRTYAEGKKIGWKDGVVALACILRYGLFIKRGLHSAGGAGSNIETAVWADALPATAEAEVAVAEESTVAETV